jgi:hypothetical protein
MGTEQINLGGFPGKVIGWELHNGARFGKLGNICHQREHLIFWDFLSPTFSKSFFWTLGTIFTGVFGELLI